MKTAEEMLKKHQGENLYPSRETILDAMKEYAQQFIDKGEAIVGPAIDILPSTYQEEIDAWYESTPLNVVT